MAQRYAKRKGHSFKLGGNLDISELLYTPNQKSLFNSNEFQMFFLSWEIMIKEELHPDMDQNEQTF